MWKAALGLLAGLAAIATIVIFVTGQRGLPQLLSDPEAPTTKSMPPPAQVARGTVPSQPSVPPDPPGATLDEVLRTLEDDRLTNLQKTHFRRRTEGTTTRLDVIVREVTPSGDNILVVFIPLSQAEKSGPDILIAEFPASAESDLASVRPGDLASIKGTLSYRSVGFSHDPSLKDCELLAVRPRR